MAYYQLHDIKRDRFPYASDVFWHRPYWAPEITNTPLLNYKKTITCTVIASTIVEPINHFWSSMKALNLAYEWPRNSNQMSIYVRETLNNSLFWSGLRKKVVYGAVQHSLDIGFKIGMFHYLFGGTWSPKHFADANSSKYLLFAFGTGFLTGWTQYPLAVARKAYYADKTWPEDLRKGYRSPLHALLKIPFSEGPLYLFRGGFLNYVGTSIGFGWTMFAFTWLKDKFFFLWKYNDINYSWIKFWFLNFSFAVGSLGSQPFFAMKDIMDRMPKERGGKTTFSSTYEAFRFLKINWDVMQPNYMAGYWKWFKSYGSIFYISLWIADNYGLLDNYRVDPNGLETSVSKFVTD